MRSLAFNPKASLAHIWKLPLWSGSMHTCDVMNTYIAFLVWKIIGVSTKKHDSCYRGETSKVNILKHITRCRTSFLWLQECDKLEYSQMNIKIYFCTVRQNLGMSFQRWHGSMLSVWAGIASPSLDSLKMPIIKCHTIISIRWLQHF